MEDIKGGYYVISNVLDAQVPFISMTANRPRTRRSVRLYAYRSKIAHGDVAQFTGTLQLLRNHEVVTSFLEGATRSLVRHALNEPELVDALKPI